jgi:hypothetical protein
MKAGIITAAGRRRFTEIVASPLPPVEMEVVSSQLEGLRVQGSQYALGNVGAEAGRHCVAFISV